MLRRIIFKDGNHRRQLTLPVTPESFEVSTGKNIETVYLQEMGEVFLPQQRTLGTILIRCMLPANSYPFGEENEAPYDTIDQLERWARGKEPIRFIVSGTPINRRVLVEQVTYGERDGTNDVYATIQLQEYEKPDAVETIQAPAVNKPRPAGVGPVASAQERTVKLGKGGHETIQSVAKKAYGSSSNEVINAIATINAKGVQAFKTATENAAFLMPAYSAIKKIVGK